MPPSSEPFALRTTFSLDYIPGSSHESILIWSAGLIDSLSSALRIGSTSGFPMYS